MCTVYLTLSTSQMCLCLSLIFLPLHLHYPLSSSLINPCALQLPIFTLIIDHHRHPESRDLSPHFFLIHVVMTMERVHIRSPLPHSLNQCVLKFSPAQVGLRRTAGPWVVLVYYEDIQPKIKRCSDL